MTKIPIFGLIFFVCSLHCVAQSQDSIAPSQHSFAPAHDTTTMHVTGTGYAYSVEEPKRWTGDRERAKDFFSNIVFYENEQSLTAGGALIQVLLFKKQDENTIDDLNHDVNGYKREFPTAKVKNVKYKHKNYVCFAKVVYLQSRFYQYICYINPGKKFQNGFSVAMNVQKREPTKQELLAFESVIQSLNGLTEN
jgi:hypothetical protein